MDRKEKIINISFAFIFVLTSIVTYFINKENTFVFSLSSALLILILMYFYSKVNVEKGIRYFVLLFIVLSIYLGKLLNFYILIPIWDLILHFISGILATYVGYSLCKERTNNKGFVILVSFLFAMSTAALWEIYEFLGDTFLGFDSQGGSLVDTMGDMIACLTGSIPVLIYLKLKKK